MTSLTPNEDAMRATVAAMRAQAAKVEATPGKDGVEARIVTQTLDAFYVAFGRELDRCSTAEDVIDGATSAAANILKAMMVNLTACDDAARDNLLLIVQLKLFNFAGRRGSIHAEANGTLVSRA